MSEESRRSYRPNSNFSVAYWPDGCSCLIGEVISNERTQEDRHRMLVQGISITWAGQVLVLKRGFALMAIYISAELVAIRYFLQVDTWNEDVRLRSAPVGVNRV